MMRNNPTRILRPLTKTTALGRRSFVAATTAATALPFLPAIGAERWPADLPQFVNQQRMAGKLTVGAEEAKALLEGGRYVADGDGAPIYVWVSQNCGPSHDFLSNTRPKLNSVQFRYYTFPASADSIDQQAHVGATRTLADFTQYMQRTLPAQDARSSPALGDAFNDTLNRCKRLSDLLALNNLAPKIKTPNFFWLSGGDVCWARAFNYNNAGGRKAIEAMIASAKA